MQSQKQWMVEGAELDYLPLTLGIVLTHGKKSNHGMVVDPFQDAIPCFEQEPIRLLECGCCGCFHPEDSFKPGGSANYMNDCRYDANRFRSDEDFTERTGLPCVEVWLDEQEEFEA